MPTDDPWVSLIWMLAVIAAVIGLAWWFTRHVAGGKPFQSFVLPQKNDRLQILTQRQIGKDQRLVVAQAGERYFFLGVTAQSISLLAEFSEEEAALWLQKVEEGGNTQTPGFKQALTDLLQQRKQR